MAIRLPPLNTLRLFEAAGRLLNFKEAAEELHITPSAVSHGIRTLEDWLGTELFRRTRQGLVLTEAGEAYLPAVRETLTGLASATERVPGRKPSGKLAISIAPSFAFRWLVPRLHRFTEGFPDIVVTIDTAKEQVIFPSDTVDLAIRLAPEARTGDVWVELVKTSMIPVYAPGLLARLTDDDGRTDLGKMPLIHVTTVSEDWDAWGRMAGIVLPASKGDVKFDTVEMAMQAAQRGIGVALGRVPLISDDLAQGNLVTLLGPPRPSALSYWLVGSELTFDRPEAKLFRRWLMSELDHWEAEPSQPSAEVAAR